jgi:beta-glucosidase
VLWTTSLRTARGLRAVLARTRSGPAALELAVAEGEPAADAWRTVASLAVPEGGDRWTWSTLETALDLAAGEPPDVADLRLRLVGAVRVATVELT